jgi:outer membrane protein assembly factor BamB
MKRIAVLIALILLASTMPVAQATKIDRWWFSNFSPGIILSSDHTQNLPMLSGSYLSWLDSRNKFHDTEGRIMPRLFMKNLDTGEEKACSAFTRKTPSRSMHKNMMVWSECQSSQPTDDNFDIVSYDFLTGAKTTVCSERRRQDNPQISKEWIIWRDWRNCQSNTDDRLDAQVYGYSLADGKEFLILDGSYQGTAELFGEYTILSIKAADKQDYDIYLYIMTSKRMIPICTAPGDQLSPKIIGNMIIWQDCRTCEKFSESKISTIYGYSLSTKKEITISTQSNREFGIVAGDRYAAWFIQQKNGFAGAMKTQIKGYDTISGKFFNITENPGIYTNMSITGKYCIYEYTNPSSDFGTDIKIFDFTTDQTWWVFKGFGDQRNPRVYGETAIWEDHKGSDSEIVTIWSASLKNPQSLPEPTKYGIPDPQIWSTQRGDNQRTGLYKSTLKKLPENPMRVQWTMEFQDSVYSSPVFNSRGYAFFGTDEKKFYSCNVFDGSRIWEFQTIGRVKASAAIYRDKVFFGDDKGVFYCLDMHTGQEIWRYQTGGPILSSPVAYQNDVEHYGCVSFVSFDKKLYTFSALAKTPTLKWVFDLGGWSVSAPAVDYNPMIRTTESDPVTKVMYVCTSNNRVLCFMASTGRLIAEYTTKTSIETSPVAFGSKVLVSVNDGMLLGLDFSSWNQKPFVTNKEDTNHPLASSALYEPTNDMLLFESTSGNIKCINERNSWVYNLGEPMKTSPALIGGRNPNSYSLVTCSDAGKLAIIDCRDGKELARMDFKSAISAAPAIFDTGYPAIIIGTVDRKLYCISQRPPQED